jgi:hypothetical protein
MLSIAFIYYYAECRYDECHYADCYDAEFRGTIKVRGKKL